MEKGFTCFQCKQQFEGQPAMILKNGPTCSSCRARMCSRRNAAFVIWKAVGIKSQNISESERDWIRNIFIDKDGWPTRDIPESRGGMLSVLMPLIEKEKEKNPLLASKLSCSVIEQKPTKVKHQKQTSTVPVWTRKHREEKLPRKTEGSTIDEVLEKVCARLLKMIPAVDVEVIKTPAIANQLLPQSQTLPADPVVKKPTKAFIHYECTSQQKQINIIHECMEHAREIQESTGRTHEATGKLLKVLATRLALAEKEVQRLKTSL